MDRRSPTHTTRPASGKEGNPFFIPARFIAFAALTLTLQTARGVEPAPEEFAGMKWGSSSEELRQAMAEKGAKVDKGWTRSDDLVYTGGTVAGFGIDFWDLHIANDRLWHGAMTFTEHNNDSEATYKAVRKMLTEKYGIPQAEATKPVSTTWKLVNNATHTEVTINLHFRDDKPRRVKVEYINETLRKSVASGQSTSEKASGL